MNPSGKTQSEDVYTTPTADTSKTASTTLTCTQTYYVFSNTPSSYFEDVNFYNMIFGLKRDFWLATRAVNCGSQYVYAGFYLECVSEFVGSNLGGCPMIWSSGDGDCDYDNSLAPVVTFDSAIQVKSGSGTTRDPYIIGK